MGRSSHRSLHWLTAPTLALLLALSLNAAALALPTPAVAQLEGSYEAIGSVPAKHSQEVVQIEEFVNFTCPHCNNFREAAKPMLAKYGSRVRTTQIPILFRGQPDTPLRLYYIADKQGKGEEVSTLIYDATFRYGVNIYDPKVVSYLARSAGLAEAYEADFNAPYVLQRIQQAHARADEAGVEATPTLVLNGALRLTPRTGIQAFVANLDKLIEQLLKKQG